MFFKWSNKFDWSTNVLQTSWQTSMNWFNSYESPLLLPTKQCLWNRPLQLSYDGCKRIEIGLSKTENSHCGLRDYKRFDNEKFRLDIETCGSERNLKCFKEPVFCIFKKYAPIKRKYVRANEASFMTKELHKANNEENQVNE